MLRHHVLNLLQCFCLTFQNVQCFFFLPSFAHSRSAVMIWFYYCFSCSFSTRSLLKVSSPVHTLSEEIKACVAELFQC